MASVAVPPSRKITVTPVLFSGKNKDGDYKWMVKQPQYADAIFILMENFLDMLGDAQTAGGGSACLRPYTFRGTGGDESRVRALGIPTGWSTNTQGFPQLDKPYSKKAIDLAIERLVVILQNVPSIDTIVYSCDEHDSSIVGTNIFKDSIGEDVVKYMSMLLRSVPSRVGASTFTHERITKMELGIYMYAAVMDANAWKDMVIARKDVEIARLTSATKRFIAANQDDKDDKMHGSKFAGGAIGSAHRKDNGLFFKPEAAPPPLKTIFKKQSWLKK